MFKFVIVKTYRLYIFHQCFDCQLLTFEVTSVWKFFQLVSKVENGTARWNRKSAISFEMNRQKNPYSLKLLAWFLSPESQIRALCVLRTKWLKIDWFFVHPNPNSPKHPRKVTHFDLSIFELVFPNNYKLNFFHKGLNLHTFTGRHFWVEKYVNVFLCPTFLYLEKATNFH